MDQAIHHSLKVLVLRVDDAGITATVGAHGFGSWEVAIADLVPLGPPDCDRLNGRDELTTAHESWRRHRAADRKRAGSVA